MLRSRPTRRLVLILVCLTLAYTQAGAAALSALSPASIAAALTAAITSGDDRVVQAWLMDSGRSDLASLTAAERSTRALTMLGAPLTSRIVDRREQAGGTTVSLDVRGAGGTAHWRIVFDDQRALIARIMLTTTPVASVVVAGGSASPPPPPPSTAPSAARRYHRAFRRGADGDTNVGAAAGAPPPIPTAPSPTPPPSSTPAPPLRPATASGAIPIPTAIAPAEADSRMVEFLLATTRRTKTSPLLRLTADRADGLTLGIVRVHVPLDHTAGQVELPRRISFAGFTLYEEKLDEKKHFVVSGVRLIGESDFYRFATGDPTKTALIFVHGFNNTFEDSAYRLAQILYDLHYDKPAILFSWASRGSVLDYLYDKDSAESARDRFSQLIRKLRSMGVEHVEVIAHSMGNYLAIPALADSADSVEPNRVDQFVMAAPDVERGYFVQEAAKLSRIATGLTLYACSTDRALQASKDAAGGAPRAGDVPSQGPVIVPGVDTIDVSALGSDWFGLNHDVFASNRSVMADIAALLKEGKHPPRIDAVKGMPLNTTPTTFWRFVTP